MTENKEHFLHYLLGDLPEAERERLEQEYFMKPAVLETLAAAEDDLIDRYVGARLSPEQRRQFESYFLRSPQKRKRLEFAANLRAVLQDRKAEPKAGQRLRNRFLVGTGIAAAVLALVAWGVRLTVQNRNLRNGLDKSYSAQVELQHRIEELQVRMKLPAVPKAESGLWPSPTGETVSILLPPGLVREIGQQTDHTNHILALPSSAFSAVLVLQLDEVSAESYDFVLRTPEGKEIRRIQALNSQPTPNGRAVIVDLPPRLLDQGDYIASLLARNSRGQTQELRPYSFTVTR